jgi:hypothetical protein
MIKMMSTTKRVTEVKSSQFVNSLPCFYVTIMGLCFCENCVPENVNYYQRGGKNLALIFRPMLVYFERGKAGQTQGFGVVDGVPFAVPLGWPAVCPS